MVLGIYGSICVIGIYPIMITKFATPNLMI